MVNLRPASFFKILISVVQTLFLNPGAWFQTLDLALRHRLPGIKSTVWSIFYFIEAMILAKELRKRHIQHLHSHFANAGANVGLFASKYIGIGWSLTLHGLSDFSYPSSPLLSAKIGLSTFTVCISHFAKAQAYLISPPEIWERIILSRCGVSSKNLPKRKNRSDKNVRFICVGRLSPEKGHIGLISSFNNLMRKGISNIELSIIGDGPERSRIGDEVVRLGLEKHVRLQGAISESEVFNELADADIFVLSSFMEGLPVVLIEAIAMGIPCIAPNVAGIPEIILNERTGLLFTVSRWDELEVQMLRLYQEPDMRKCLADCAVRHFEEVFELDKSLEPFSRKLLSLYEGSNDLK